MFNPNLPPALHAGRGETIIIETQDCYGGGLTEDPKTYGRADDKKRNPVTGPIYVEGADVGDVLCVHIQQINVASSGVVILKPDFGILGKDVRHHSVRRVPIDGDRVELSEGVSVPMNPVIGVIGVAPRHGEISTLYPGRHGGNMDTLEITTGTRIFLPVQVKGALLSLGDVKACMGDGQTTGGGVEVGAEITIRLDTLPGGRFSWPRLESQNACVTIASASSVDQAARLAVMEMVRWLEQDKGLDFETAYLVVGVSGDLRISQWVNPLITARVILPKGVMHKIQRRASIGTRSVFVNPSEHEDEYPVDNESENMDTPKTEQPTSEVASGAATTDEIESESIDAAGASEEGEEKSDTRSSPSRRRRWRRRRRPSQEKKAREGNQVPNHEGEPGSSGEQIMQTPPPETASDDGTPQNNTEPGQKEGDSTRKTESSGARPSSRRRRPWRRRSSRSSSRTSRTDKKESDSTPESSSNEGGQDKGAE